MWKSVSIANRFRGSIFFGDIQKRLIEIWYIEVHCIIKSAAAVEILIERHIVERTIKPNVVQIFIQARIVMVLRLIVLMLSLLIVGRLRLIAVMIVVGCARAAVVVLVGSLVVVVVRVARYVA